MKKILGPLFFLLSFVHMNAQNTFTSGILFDNTTFSYLTGPRLVQLADGSYLTAGKPASSPDQFFLTKYDANGIPLWQKQIDVTSLSQNSNYFYCNVTPLSDSGFLFLTYKLLYPSQHTNLVLSRFDKNGNITLQHSYYYPGNLYDAELFAVSDSEYVLCGRAWQYTTQQDLYNQGVVFWEFDGSCNFINQHYMRPAYPSPQFVNSTNVHWQFARDISGGYIVSGEFLGMTAPDGVLQFRTDSSYLPSTGIYYDNATTNLGIDNLQSDGQGGYWIIGQTDSSVSYPYYQDMLTVLHYNSTDQLTSSKRYYSLDSAAQYYQLMSAVDPATRKLYITRSLSQLTYPVARPMEVVALDNTGELISAGSMNAAETGGIIVTNHQPVMLCRGAENSWSNFSLLARMDTTSMISCFDLGNPLSTSRPFVPPLANSIAINPIVDSTLSVAGEAISVSNATFPVALDYCLTAGTNQNDTPANTEVIISQQNEQLTVQYNRSASNASCSIYDLQGNVVNQVIITNGQVINTSTLANGVYILQLTWNDQTSWSRKVVIVH